MNQAGNRTLERIVPPLWALLIALGAASMLIASIGGNPHQVLGLLSLGTWRSGYGFGQVLFKATPLLFTGLSVAMALEAGLFNIGAEGQITVGALAAALAGATLPVGTPHWLAIFLCVVASFAGGALVGGIAGILKAWRGSHEVITTIMLNFIVRAAMVGLGGTIFLRESVHTRPVIEAARFARFSQWLSPSLFKGSAVNDSLFLALLVCLLVWVFLNRTTAGFALRVVGASPGAAEAAGISPGRVTAWALALSGGLAGLGGCNFVLGYKYYYEDGFSGGVGFMGIAVAVLAFGSPLALIFAALLFGTLSQGGLAINAVVPKELVDVLEAVIIFAVAGTKWPVRRMLSRSSSKISSGEKT